MTELLRPISSKSSHGKSLMQAKFERAFDQFMPSSDGYDQMFGNLPEPTKAGPASTADYARADTCPYCKEPMVLTSVRLATGQVEKVYLCRSDRAVGVVPTEAC